MVTNSRPKMTYLKIAITSPGAYQFSRVDFSCLCAFSIVMKCCWRLIAAWSLVIPIFHHGFLERLPKDKALRRNDQLTIKRYTSLDDFNGVHVRGVDKYCKLFLWCDVTTPWLYLPRNNAKYKQKTKATAALQLGIMGALAGTIIHIWICS
jgi:hypothetical protein